MFYGFPEQLSSAGTQPMFDTTDMMYSAAPSNRTIWYTVKSGTWNDPTIWRCVGNTRLDYPNFVLNSTLPVDDVYIRHLITISISVTVNNIFINSGATLQYTAPNILTVRGNMQCKGSFINSSSSSLILQGKDNFINTFTAASGTVTYSRNGDQNIMNLSYFNLSVGAVTINCTKYMTSDLTIGGVFTPGQVTGGATLQTFECGSYNLTVNGSVQSSGNGGMLSKAGAGSILIIGVWNFNTGNSSGFDFSGGNPTVELRGGIVGTSSIINRRLTGTGQWSFTTNNQTISAFTVGLVFSCPVLISGAITLTNAASNILTFNDTLDGDNAASTLDNRGTVNYSHATRPMATGVITANAAANTFVYNKAGAQDVQGGTTHLTTAQYWHLTLSVSGAKTLQGNVSVLNTYTLSGTATKNNNGFTFGNP